MRWAAARYYSSASTRSRPDVRIVEVAPRDGLQNIKQIVPEKTKIELIQRLATTGLRDIEATSFVSPKWVPQLADGHAVFQETLRFAKTLEGGSNFRFPVLAPNLKGLQNAKVAGANEVVVFASVTEAFSKANMNCSVDQAIALARLRWIFCLTPPSPDKGTGRPGRGHRLARGGRLDGGVPVPTIARVF